MTRPRLVAAWLVAIALAARRLLVRRQRRRAGRRAAAPSGSAAPNDRGGGDPALDDPALDAAAQRTGRGPGLPARRRPGRRRAALRPRPGVDARLAAPSRGSRRWSSGPPTDADQFQLDLGEPLTVSELTVDGEPADFEEDGKDLVVRDPRRGRPPLPSWRSTTAARREPVPAPTTRSDFDSSAGRSPTAARRWTMQEPYGAFTWYAVNDQPSDKALYDFTISTPAPVGRRGERRAGRRARTSTATR